MLTVDELRKMGIEGKKIGPLIKLSKDWNPEEQDIFLKTGKLPEKESLSCKKGSVWDYLCNNPALAGWHSKSEKRRWLVDSAVVLNGLRPKPDDICPDEITELVFFPNSNNKITML